MTSKTVSVIIAAFNAEPYLAAALQSVLTQTCPPTEVLVIDDGSSDNSASVAQAYAPWVQVFRQANRGPAAARNVGIRHSTGENLAFIDADDLWMPEKLARQMEILQGDSACEAVLGKVVNFITPELNDEQCGLLASRAGLSGAFLVGAMLIRRSAFMRVGEFNEQWRHGDFIDWWARATDLGLRYTAIPELVMQRRLHTNNMTRREPLGAADYVRILHKQIRLRRERLGNG